MYFTVYKTTNILNGKIYIGVHQTENPDDDYLGSGSVFCRALKKHGRDSFKKEVLFVFGTREEMLAKERDLVDRAFVDDPGTYNVSRGGNPINFGRPELSASNAGKLGQEKLRERKLKDPEFLENIRNNAREKFLKLHAEGRIPHCKSFQGKKHSEETRKKIGELNSVSHLGSKNTQFGKVWIHKSGEKPKVVHLECLNSYFLEGWCRGRVEKKPASKRITIRKPNNPDRSIEENRLQKYIDEGWDIGGTPSGKERHTFTNSVWIHKDSLSKRIQRSSLEEYLSLGWSPGRSKG